MQLGYVGYHGHLLEYRFRRSEIEVKKGHNFKMIAFLLSANWRLRSKKQARQL